MYSYQTMTYYQEIYLYCQVSKYRLSYVSNKSIIILFPYSKKRYVPHHSKIYETTSESTLKFKTSKAVSYYFIHQPTYDFVPFAVETAGPWGPDSEAKSYNTIKDLGLRLKGNGHDPHFRSVLVGRYNKYRSPYNVVTRQVTKDTFCYEVL